MGPAARTVRLCRWQLSRPWGPPAQVDWSLRRAGSGWKIIDVVVEGIGMAVIRRSEVSSATDSHGGRVDGLLAVLRQMTLPADTHISAETAGTL